MRHLLLRVDLLFADEVEPPQARRRRRNCAAAALVAVVAVESQHRDEDAACCDECDRDVRVVVVVVVGRGARAKKRAKERARERIAAEPPRSRRTRAGESTSSSDNYEKFEHRVGAYDSESSASEHVLVLQTVQVAETPVAIETSGKKPRPSHANSGKSSSSKSGKRTKKKKKPAVPDDLTPPAPLEQPSSSSSSSDGELKWGRVENMKN
jgi:hypothetical protein